MSLFDLIPSSFFLSQPKRNLKLSLKFDFDFVSNPTTDWKFRLGGKFNLSPHEFQQLFKGKILTSICADDGLEKLHVFFPY